MLGFFQQYNEYTLLNDMNREKNTLTMFIYNN